MAPLYYSRMRFGVDSELYREANSVIAEHRRTLYSTISSALWPATLRKSTELVYTGERFNLTLWLSRLNLDAIVAS